MASSKSGAREAAFFLVLKMFLAAIKAVLPPQVKLTVAGTEYDRATLLQMHSDWVARFQRVEDLRSEEVKAMHERTKAEREGRKFIKDLTSALVGYYGAGAPELLRFGIKRTATKKQMTPETRLVAKAKAALTRKARGTMGPKQRAAITAEPQPVVTVTLPSKHPAPSPSPAPVAETPVRNEVVSRA